MGTKFRSEKLHIWQKAMFFGADIDQLSELLPNKELFNLTSQRSRTGDSISLHISEGSIVQSNSDQKKLIGYVNRSLAVVVTNLRKAKRAEYISETEFEKQYNEASI